MNILLNNKLKIFSLFFIFFYIIFLNLNSKSSALSKNNSESKIKHSKIKTGQRAPFLNFLDINGKKYSQKSMLGKKNIIIFFTTWCGACLDELKYFEKHIWSTIKNSKNKNKYSFVAIGRKHAKNELLTFKQKNQLTLPMASDKNAKIYGVFAKKTVPRAYLINENLQVIYQTQGFDEEECEYMKNLFFK